MLDLRPFINNKFISTNHLHSKVCPLNLKKHQIHAAAISNTHEAIKSSFEAYNLFKATSQYYKQDLLSALHQDVKRNKLEFAEIIHEETGKPKTEAIAEVNYALSYIQYYAAECIRLNGDIIPSSTPSQEIKITRHPLGVAVLILPWNLPLALAVRKVAAALACGCSIIVKPAIETVKTTCRFAQSCLDSNLPPGIVNVLPIKSEEIKDHISVLASDERIAKFSITGSTAAGISLYQESAKYMKKVSMELGGNASFIVFDDADIDRVITELKVAKLRNCGQTCIAANRLFVHSSIKEKFIEKTVKMLEDLQVAVDFGPLISKKALDKTTDLVERAIAEGAEVIYKKEFNAPNHLYFAPIVLTNITPLMTLYRTEVFSPVFPIIEFDSVDEVIELTNTVPYGLANYIFSKNINTIQRCSKEIESGMLGINTCTISQAAVPFGGIKLSGFGREGGRYGLDEYSYLKYTNQDFQ